MPTESIISRLAIKHHHYHPGRPTLVFLHDSLGCISLWRDFPDRLAEELSCNLLVYDRQGYGRSGPFSYSQRTVDYMEWEADILVELLEYYQINQPILFGHSDGGSIALIAAGKYPDRFKGLITEGAHIFVEDITLTGIRAARQKYQATELPRKLQKYHSTKTEAMFRAWTDTWLDPAFRSWNIEHFLPTIGCPALIVQGEEDEYGTLWQVERSLELIGSRARKLVLPGVGHSPHKEADLALRKAVQDFLKSEPTN